MVVVGAYDGCDTLSQVPVDANCYLGLEHILSPHNPIFTHKRTRIIVQRPHGAAPAQRILEIHLGQRDTAPYNPRLRAIDGYCGIRGIVVVCEVNTAGKYINTEVCPDLETAVRGYVHLIYLLLTLKNPCSSVACLLDLFIRPG